MQELPLSNKLFARLSNGTKNITIRKGRRDIELGFLVFTPDDLRTTPLPEPRVVNVTEIRYKRVSNITDSESQVDGYKDAANMFVEMLKYYPTLAMEDEVTLILFDT